MPLSENLLNELRGMLPSPIVMRLDVDRHTANMWRLHPYANEELVLCGRGRLYRLKTGVAWELLHAETADSETDGILWEGRAAEFGGKLYIGGSHAMPIGGPAFILCYDGATVTKVFDLTLAAPLYGGSITLKVMGAYIYAALHTRNYVTSTDLGEVYRSADGLTWTHIRSVTEGFVWDMEVYRDLLWLSVATRWAAVPYLWTFDGVAAWTRHTVAPATHITRTLGLCAYAVSEAEPYRRLYVGTECYPRIASEPREEYSACIYTDDGAAFHEVRLPLMGSLGGAIRPLFGSGHVVLNGAGMVMTNGMRWMQSVPSPIWLGDFQEYQSEIYIATSQPKSEHVRKRVALLKYGYTDFVNLFKPIQGALQLLKDEAILTTATLVSPEFPGSSKVSLSINDSTAAVLDIQWAPNGKDFEDFVTGIPLAAATPYAWMTQYEAPLWRLKITQGALDGVVNAWVSLR